MQSKSGFLPASLLVVACIFSCPLCDGTITHATLRRMLIPTCRKIENDLLRGFGTAARGMCKELHDHKQHLWTFLQDPTVEPTKNASKRSLRHRVRTP